MSDWVELWKIMVEGTNPCLRFVREEAPMHLASDYIHSYKDAGGRPARCRVHIYLPDEAGDFPE